MRVLLLVLMLLPGLAWADGHAQVEKQPVPATQAGSTLAELTELFGEGGSQAVTAGDALVGIEPIPEVAKAANTYAVGYYTNLTEGLVHRRKVFEWQYTSSLIIFFVVIGIVLIGLYFSWMQFHAAKDGQVGETTMEASKDGFKLSSPVLGVVILVLSLAFFYLYLVHVYPISEIGGG
ncbi:hypothetical protein [uncultured Litoreibacter sp.]|uniref:hypothetical protein n=1 Tax=uncultured Litoreibacter sp. TaxID=1392394 RepID=UPI0026103EE3|nr:hypothetical protein [uncultured Litoreibacter sp.]